MKQERESTRTVVKIMLYCSLILSERLDTKISWISLPRSAVSYWQAQSGSNGFAHCRICFRFVRTAFKANAKLRTRILKQIQRWANPLKPFWIRWPLNPSCSHWQVPHSAWSTACSNMIYDWGIICRELKFVNRTYYKYNSGIFF